jgi:transposase
LGREGRRAELPGALTLDDREELKRLRKENKRLEMEREIPKKGEAFFAQENS